MSNLRARLKRLTKAEPGCPGCSPVVLVTHQKGEPVPSPSRCAQCGKLPATVVAVEEEIVARPS